MKSLTLGSFACLALVAACGSDDDPAPPGIARDAATDKPAEAANDARNDARDAGTDARDATSDTSDAGADASDTGTDARDAGGDGRDSSADSNDGGADAADSGADADADIEPRLVLCPLLAGKTPVAASPDGKLVAYLSCAQTNPAVVVYELATKKSSELGPAPADSSIEWLLDGKYVYYGSASETYVRAADVATPAVRISTGTIDGHRAFQERISNTAFAPRLLVLETDGGVHRVSARKVDDGYTTRLTLIEDAALALDISQLSASGRTLIATVAPAQGTSQYRKMRTNNAQPMSTLPFTPNDWVMAPTGLGDTHNFALHDDRLVRIELDTGVIAELVPAGSGLLAGNAHLLDREDAPGKKHVYFIQNGDPSRRIREGTEPTEVLATANAVAQAMTPDLLTILYLSDQQLYAVSAEGGGAAARPLVSETNAETKLNLAFSTTTRDVAYVANRKLFRIALANDAVQPFSDTIDPASVKFDGLGQAILFITEAGALKRASPGSADPATIAPSVQGFWPVPTTTTVLVAINGELETRSAAP